MSWQVLDLVHKRVQDVDEQGASRGPLARASAHEVAVLQALAHTADPIGHVGGRGQPYLRRVTRLSEDQVDRAVRALKRRGVLQSANRPCTGRAAAYVVLPDDVGTLIGDRQMSPRVPRTVTGQEQLPGMAPGAASLAEEPEVPRTPAADSASTGPGLPRIGAVQSPECPASVRGNEAECPAPVRGHTEVPGWLPPPPQTEARDGGGGSTTTRTPALESVLTYARRLSPVERIQMEHTVQPYLEQGYTPEDLRACLTSTPLPEQVRSPAKLAAVRLQSLRTRPPAAQRRRVEQAAAVRERVVATAPPCDHGEPGGWVPLESTGLPRCPVCRQDARQLVSTG